MTAQILAKRRDKTLREPASCTGKAKTRQDGAATSARLVSHSGIAPGLVAGPPVT